MKKILSFALIALLINLNFSCTENENEATPDEKEKILETKATIGGEAFVPSSTVAFKNTEGKAFFSLTAGEKTILFSTSSTTVGTYPVPAPEMRIAEGSISSASIVVNSILYTAISGTIEIKSVADGKISGTFSFTAKDVDGNSIEIKEGVFSELTFSQPALTDLLINKTWEVTSYKLELQGCGGEREVHDKAIGQYICEERSSINSPECGLSPEWCNLEKAWVSYKIKFFSNNTSKAVFFNNVKKTNKMFSDSCALKTESSTTLTAESISASWTYNADASSFKWDLGTTAAGIPSEVSSEFTYEVSSFSADKIFLTGTKVIEGCTLYNQVVLE